MALKLYNYIFWLMDFLWFYFSFPFKMSYNSEESIAHYVVAKGQSYFFFTVLSVQTNSVTFYRSTLQEKYCKSRLISLIKKRE